jgi:hypothetical protein
MSAASSAVSTDVVAGRVTAAVRAVPEGGDTVVAQAPSSSANAVAGAMILDMNGSLEPDDT